jgi:hypothetical protein
LHARDNIASNIVRRRFEWPNIALADYFVCAGKLGCVFKPCHCEERLRRDEAIQLDRHGALCAPRDDKQGLKTRPSFNAAVTGERAKARDPPSGRAFTDFRIIA